MELLNKIIADPYSWLVLSLILIVVAKILFKLDYMNCSLILSRHINNFKSNGKILKVPFIIHFIVPAFLAIFLSKVKTLDKDMINNIIVIFAILMSMLFTLLVLTIEVKTKIEAMSNTIGGRINRLKTLLLETYSTIMYEIIVAIVLLIVSFVYLFNQEMVFFVSILIYYLVFNFLFNLFMLLKRMFILIEETLKN